MTAQIVYGTDFRRSSPKADRAFWIGPEHALAHEVRQMLGKPADTAPCEYCAPDTDSA